MLLLDPYGLNKFISFFDMDLSADGQQFMKKLINSINHFTTTKEINGESIIMTKFAWELYRTDNFINEQLFIYINDTMNKILLKLKSYKSPSKYDLFKERNGLHIYGFKRSYEEFEITINDYLTYFMMFHVLLMDVYTLSRMFIQHGDEIIVYTGVYHTHQYDLFFNQINADKLFEIKINKDTLRCLSSELLPEYIEINKYRQYALNL